MSNQVDEVDYMAEERDAADFIDEMDEENNGGASANIPDAYDMVWSLLLLPIASCFPISHALSFIIWILVPWIHFEQLTKITDTSAVQARNGKDIQGIPWERLNITRDKYRLTRIQQYKNYVNVPEPVIVADKVHFLS